MKEDGSMKLHQVVEVHGRLAFRLSLFDACIKIDIYVLMKQADGRILASAQSGLITDVLGQSKELNQLKSHRLRRHNTRTRWSDEQCDSSASEGIWAKSSEHSSPRPDFRPHEMA
jgi:hypothetical protein